jgi:hypothetical protein
MDPHRKPSTTLPADLPVRAGRDRYLADNAFTLEGYTAPTATIKVAGRYWTFPNTPNRQQALPWHDLHHVATGYGTDLVGEAEIRTGCTSFIAYYLNATAMLGGLFLAPRRLWRAWAAAKGCRSFYRHPMPYDDVLNLTLGEMRAYLGIPPAGHATQPAKLHPDAPAAAKYQTAT